MGNTKESMAWDKISRRFDDKQAYPDLSPQAKRSALDDAKKLSENIEDRCEERPVTDKRQCVKGASEAVRELSFQTNYPVWIQTRMAATSSILHEKQSEMR